MRWMPGAASRSNVDPLTTRAYPRAPAKNRRPGGLVAGVGLQVGVRVDRMPAPVPLAEPELEVKVAGGRVTRLPDDPDLLAGLDDLPLRNGGPRRQVRVHVVLVQLLVADHDVVAGEALEAHELDLRAADGDEGRAAGGHDVLALVATAARARRSDALAERVRAGDREDHRAGWSARGCGAAGSADAAALREGQSRAEDRERNRRNGGRCRRPAGRPANRLFGSCLDHSLCGLRS